MDFLDNVMTHSVGMVCFDTSHITWDALHADRVFNIVKLDCQASSKPEDLKTALSKALEIDFSLIQEPPSFAPLLPDRWDWNGIKTMVVLRNCSEFSDQLSDLEWDEFFYELGDFSNAWSQHIEPPSRGGLLIVFPSQEEGVFEFFEDPVG